MRNRILSYLLCIVMLLFLFNMPVISLAQAQNEIIVDNTDEGFTTDGSEWRVSVSIAGSRFYGDDYLHDNSPDPSPDKWAKWTPVIPEEGEYRIYMMWASHNNRAKAVPVEIQYAGGTDTSVTVDQSKDGAEWNLLGTYNLSAGDSNYVKILATSSGYTVADAVKFERVTGDEPVVVGDVIVDNEDEGCVLTNDPNTTTTDGVWKTSTSNSDYYGKNYATTTTSVASGAYATWTPDLPVAGKYNVYVWWSSLSNRASEVPIEVKHADGTYQATVNERTNGGRWNLIGTYNFAAGTESFVKLFASGSGYTTADAVKFEYIHPFNVTNVSDYQVYQRNIGGTFAQVPVTVTNNNENTVSIKARVLKHGTDEVVVDWTELVTTNTTGTIMKELTVPQGGWYQTEIAAYDAGGEEIQRSLSNKKWGVGIVILCAGQSNMEGHGRTPYTVAHDLVANFNKSNTWGHLVDPYADMGGSMAPALGNALVEKYHIPVAFVPTAVGGSGLCQGSGPKVWSSRNAENPSDTSSYYGNSISRAQQAGGVELIVWFQGSTDGRYVADYTTYLDAFNKLVENYRTDLYSTIPVFLCQIGNHEVSDTVNNDAWFSGIRTAQALADNGQDVFMGSTAVEFPRVDGAHFTSRALDSIGERMANAISYYYGDADYYRGPEIVSADFLDDTQTSIDVHVRHRGGDTLTAAEEELTGFTVVADGAPVAVASARILNADTIRLTLESKADGTAAVRYLYGINPDVTNVVKDNSTLQLPLEGTLQDIPVSQASGVRLTMGEQVTVTSAKDLSAVLVIAAYEGNKMMGIKTYPVSITADVPFNQAIPEEFTAYSSIKAMLWQDFDAISPLSAFAEK